MGRDMKHRQMVSHLKKGLQALGAVALGLALTSCGGGDADPMASYTNQTLVWQACDPERVGGGYFPDLLTMLSDQTQCADVRVPRDYANPAKGELTVAMLRVKGLQTTDRRTSILINPGGPGVDGVPYALMLAAYWRVDGTTDADVVPLYKDMVQRFDLIGFSPRGTGWSTPLTCVPQRELRFVNNPTRDLSQDNVNNTIYNNQVIAESCQGNPLTPDINTDATARDMDLIRHLLGEDKLNFIGASYGSWLGNWYASLFPERVGRMLLSGVTDFSEPLSHQEIVQEGALQRVLEEVVIPFAEANPQRFGTLANDARDLRSMLGNLPDALHYATVDTLEESQFLSNAYYAEDAVMILLAAKLIQAQLDANPGLDEQTLLSTLAAYPFSTDARLDESAHLTAASVARGYFLQVAGKPKVKDEGMFWAVVCNDAAIRYTPETWLQASNRNAALYPDFGGLLRDNACLYWPPSGITRPPQERAATAGPILMLQTELDPLTVLTGAEKSLSLLPNARMIEITGEYTHAPLPPYGTSCVDKPIAHYFLDGTLPANTRCDGLPLPAQR